MSLTAVNLDQDTLAKLDASAAFRSLSREATLREAIGYLTEEDCRFRASVEAGLKDIEEGRVISNEEMKSRAKALIQSFRDKKQGRQ